MLVFSKRIVSRRFGADFNEVVGIFEDIHRVRFSKPLHYPVAIGGHCLIPNVELLLKSVERELIQRVI